MRIPREIKITTRQWTGSLPFFMAFVALSFFLNYHEAIGSKYYTLNRL